MKTGNNRNIRNKSGTLLHQELTEKIIGICYLIHHQYSSGQKESVYQKALAEKLNLEKIPHQQEVSIDIRSVDTRKKLGSHRLDFVIDNKVILEIKAIKFTPRKLEQQLYSYLKNSPYELGLMINFGSSKLYIRRIIYTH
jgi:GxxExxY protein